MTAPVDRVQLRKNESVAGGGSSADDYFGFPATLDPTQDAPEVQGVFFQPPGGPKDETTYITRDPSGNLIFKDVVNGIENTLSAMLSGGSGLTEGAHETLDTLTHEIVETSFAELEYQDPEKKKRPIRFTTWTTPAMTKKIREILIVYGSEGLKKKPIQVDTIQFDGVGVEKVRLVELLTYSTTKPKNKLLTVDRTRI